MAKWPLPLTLGACRQITLKPSSDTPAAAGAAGPEQQPAIAERRAAGAAGARLDKLR